MKRIVLVTALALAGGAGMAQAQVAAPDYVKMAGASDKFEITEAKLAQQRSHSAKVKRFAAMMVTDHTKSTVKIKAAARKTMGHAPPPPMLDDEQQSDLAALKATHGAREFDRTYLDQQVASHQKALELQQGYAQTGDAPSLRKAAGEITPVVEHHLSMAKELQAAVK